jgi:hypothetical protein
VSPWTVPGEEIPGSAGPSGIIATVCRYRLTERVTIPAGKGHAFIAGRVRDLIGRPLTGAPAGPRAARRCQERSGSQATQQVVTRSDEDHKRALRGSWITTARADQRRRGLQMAKGADSGSRCDADVEGDGFG